jgi:hypothetical protein
MAMSALRPTPETKTHLAALVGDAKVTATRDKYLGDLQNVRTIKLGKVAKAEGSAEFFVMFTPSGAGGAIEGVKFVSGDEKLKGFSDTLKSAHYSVSFPDDIPTKILRRGVLSCSKLTGECMFVMMLPADVHSVD